MKQTPASPRAHCINDKNLEGLAYYIQFILRQGEGGSFYVNAVDGITPIPTKAVTREILLLQAIEAQWEEGVMLLIAIGAKVQGEGPKPEDLFLWKAIYTNHPRIPGLLVLAGASLINDAHEDFSLRLPHEQKKWYDTMQKIKQEKGNPSQLFQPYVDLLIRKVHYENFPCMGRLLKDYLSPCYSNEETMKKLQEAMKPRVMPSRSFIPREKGAMLPPPARPKADTLLKRPASTTFAENIQEQGREEKKGKHEVRC